MQNEYPLYSDVIEHLCKDIQKPSVLRRMDTCRSYRQLHKEPLSRKMQYHVNSTTQVKRASPLGPPNYI